MVRNLQQRFAPRPVMLVTVVTLAFAAVLFVVQAAPAAAQATATRPVGTAIATTAATTGQGAGTAVATRTGTTAATARPRATGTGGGAAATAARPAATRPAAAGTRPAGMPRTGGGGMATSFVGEDSSSNSGLWLGLAGLVGVAGAGTVYARRLRRS